MQRIFGATSDRVKVPSKRFRRSQAEKAVADERSKECARAPTNLFADSSSGRFMGRFPWRASKVLGVVGSEAILSFRRYRLRAHRYTVIQVTLVLRQSMRSGSHETI